jgi:hypothetical protein
VFLHRAGHIPRTRLSSTARAHVHNDTDVSRVTAYDRCMISTILIVLLVLWVLGLATSTTLGGLIHILLIIAIIVVLLRIINGQNPLRG